MDVYVKINWQNRPVTQTPIHAENLNHMDNQIYKLTLEKADLTDLPTKLSELTNDTNYQTLTQVQNLISNLGNIITFKGIVATTAQLPTTGNKVGDMWLVGELAEAKEEYIWTESNTWELIGYDTVVDLSNYFTKAEVEALLGGKVGSVDIKQIRSSGVDFEYTVDGTTWIKIESGQSGATFIPSVSTDGYISWSNDKGLPNPATRYIKGDKGEKGDNGSAGITVTDEIPATPLPRDADTLNGQYATYYAKQADMTTVSNQVATKGSKVKLFNLTLTVANWATTAPFTQTVLVTGYNAVNNYAPWRVPVGADDTVYDAITKSGVKVTNDSVNGQLTFTATKELPTIDIPIIIEMSDVYA